MYICVASPEKEGEFQVPSRTLSTAWQDSS